MNRDFSVNSPTVYPRLVLSEGTTDLAELNIAQAPSDVMPRQNPDDTGTVPKIINLQTPAPVEDIVDPQQPKDVDFQSPEPGTDPENNPIEHSDATEDSGIVDFWVTLDRWVAIGGIGLIVAIIVYTIWILSKKKS